MDVVYLFILVFLIVHVLHGDLRIGFCAFNGRHGGCRKSCGRGLEKRDRRFNVLISIISRWIFLMEIWVRATQRDVDSWEETGAKKGKETIGWGVAIGFSKPGVLCFQGWNDARTTRDGLITTIPRTKTYTIQKSGDRALGFSLISPVLYEPLRTIPPLEPHKREGERWRPVFSQS